MGDVKAFDRHGEKITLPEEAVPELVKLGGRVASKEEIAAARVDADYAQKSLPEKAFGVAAYAGPLTFAASLAAAGEAPQMPPEMAAYAHGVNQFFPGEHIVKGAVGLRAGDPAAKSYAQQVEAAAAAHPEWKTAGQIAGLGGSIVAGGPKGGMGKLVPTSALGLAGDLAEGAAARALGGVAERGVIGQAVATGAKYAARGGVEGALFEAGNQINEDVFADRDLAAQKVYTAMGHGLMSGMMLGGGLGAGGSLAASGLKGTVKAGASIISRLSRGAEEAAPAAAKAAAEPTPSLPLLGRGDALSTRGGEASAEAPRPAPRPKSAPEPVAVGTKAEDGARSVANDLAFDALGTTRKVADKINTEVEGGTRAVGEWVNKRIIRAADENTSLIDTIKSGRADEILPRITAERGSIGRQIGDEVRAYPTRVAIEDVVRPGAKILDEMLKDPTRIQGAEAFKARIAQVGEALQNAGQIKEGTISLSDMYYARAKMEGVAHELSAGKRASAAQESFENWLRDVDRTLVNKLDETAKLAGDKGAKERLLGLKRDYHLASWAETAATDGTNRVRGNNIFGIREGVGAAIGLAMGSPLAAVGTAIAGKMLRERGAAAGAYLLSKAADLGTIKRMAEAVDDQVRRSAKGILAEPARGEAATARPRVEPRAQSGRVQRDRTAQVKAQAIVKWATEVRSNPQATMRKVEETSTALAKYAPETGYHYTATALRAINLIASKIPAREPRDPLNPKSQPRLTDREAASLVRTAEYAARPMKFYEDVERGKITREGIAVARELTPKLYQEFQQTVLATVQGHLANGKRVPYAQRLKIGLLLGIPTDATLRPKTIRFLQALHAPAAPDQAPAPANNPPVNLQAQQSKFDSFEAPSA